MNADFLDKHYQTILDGRVFAGMAHLTADLRAAYDSWSDDQWFHFCREVCPAHPIHALLQQDPFTRHSFCRPRGYPGDAGLMDIIYQITPVPQDTTALGNLVYQFGINTPAAQSVRIRRLMLAAAIDQTARKIESPRVLCVASGHARELEFSRAVQSGQIEVLTAFDQDEVSLAEVERSHGHLKVETVRGSVLDLVGGSVELAPYDLIYSAGLYDYLLQPLARRLTAALFGFLKPGGTLLLANFLPSLRDIGYMEAFMNWPLVYRSAQELSATTALIEPERIARQSCFTDPPGGVVFLEIEKA